MVRVFASLLVTITTFGGMGAESVGQSLPPVKRGLGEHVPLAVGKFVVGSEHGTATVIAPRRKDGRWDVLTVAHCVLDARRGTLHTQFGERITLVVGRVDVSHDLAWMVTERDDLDLYAAKLAEAPAKEGDEVWVCGHAAGYGPDVEGLRREGKVGGRAFRRRDHFLLPVTFGDSGSAIFDSRGRVVGVVCSTRQPRGPRGPVVSDVLGSPFEEIVRQRPE